MAALDAGVPLGTSRSLLVMQIRGRQLSTIEDGKTSIATQPTSWWPSWLVDKGEVLDWVSHLAGVMRQVPVDDRHYPSIRPAGRKSGRIYVGRTGRQISQGAFWQLRTIGGPSALYTRKGPGEKMVSCCFFKSLMKDGLSTGSVYRKRALSP